MLEFGISFPVMMPQASIRAENSQNKHCPLTVTALFKEIVSILFFRRKKPFKAANRKRMGGKRDFNLFFPFLWLGELK